MDSLTDSAMRVFLFLFVAIFLTACKSENQQFHNNLAVIGYVPGFDGELNAKTIDASKLTHINYAFVNVKDSAAFLDNKATDQDNFKKLVSLKKDNPNLKVLISIGGWSWSENFSDAVFTESSRRKFAESSVAIVAENDLDGVDIDWEYPGLHGEDNVFRAADKENFTLMFKAIRKKLDSLSKTTDKRYLLTTAIPCFPKFLEVTDMGKAAEYIDYVNLMAYDFRVSGPLAGHHSNLFASENYDREDSGEKAYQEYTKAGVPAGKLVLGIPFYGRSWFMKNADNRGINRLIDSVGPGGGYAFIKDTLAHQPGFVRYWDDQAKAPYLFNAEKKQLVTYDDEESVKLKCEFVKRHGMGGVMFWEYTSDPKLYLLNAIQDNLHTE